MIPRLRQLIAENPSWLYSPSSKISFLKTSTPTSGTKRSQGKIVLFVFESGRKLPTLCVKATRVYSAAEIINRNYTNLRLLIDHALKNTTNSIFAKPLYFYDDGVEAFCIETVCPGERFSVKNSSYELVLKQYGVWQTGLAVSHKKILGAKDLQRIAFSAIHELEMSSESARLLENYYSSLSIDKNIKLPEILQHGDMTPDNVLVSGNKIYFIDYDYVGLSMLPGFDLFHFLSKSKQRAELAGSFYSSLLRHLADYFENIDVEVSVYDGFLFLYYLQESVRKGVGQKKDGAELIADFEKLLEKA